MAKAKESFTRSAIEEADIPSSFIGSLLVADPYMPGNMEVMIDGTVYTEILNDQVVLPIEEFEDGGDDFVIGLIINVPHHEAEQMDQIAAQHDLSCVSSVAEKPCLYGGIVEHEHGFIITENDPTNLDPYNGERVGALRYSRSIEELKDLFAGEGTERFAFVLGRVQWRREDLIEQMRRGQLHAIDLDESIVLDLPIEERWETALSRVKGYENTARILRSREALASTPLPDKSRGPN